MNKKDAVIKSESYFCPSTYVSYIASVLRTQNSDLRDEVARALAWSGLHDTKAWEELSDEEIQYIDYVMVESKKTNPDLALKLNNCK